MLFFQWTLLCDWSALPSTLTTLSMLGVLVGACVCGQLADMYGRRLAMFAAYIVMCVVMLLSAVVPTWQLYAVCRTLLGAATGGKHSRTSQQIQNYGYVHYVVTCQVFISGTLVVNQSMPLEFVSKRWRTFCGCIGFWAVGIMVIVIS